ncbi:MAG: DUF5683 domain-containing protein [Bacteroidota bacterium]
MNKLLTYLLIIFLASVFSGNTCAQSQDSVPAGEESLETNNTDKQSGLKRSPLKASIYSAVLPGAGQIYNRKYWKVPIVYAGIGTFTYLGFQYQQQFTRYKSALINRQNGEPDEFEGLLSDNAIENEMDRLRRMRDLNIIGATLMYLLQIIDANVDASLSDFDVSDDLSLMLKPVRTHESQPMTLCLSLNF